ncbi:MAG: transporter substrate-binding domain-containing protein, partial [Acetobacteraceae bacterium]|nr:transporter substrate-binding domain-containing protein [Acetobacteraceae bacterium]
MRPITKLARRGLALACMLPLLAAVAWAQPAPPAPGTDPTIDRIRKSGVLRAAAIGEVPWLPENTSGSGEPFSGPAWLLAKEYARLLGVRLEPVAVSHETKVPILASGQADITIAPLSETPARDKVIDFVVYSKSSLCLFGRADNPKLRDAKTVDDLDKPNITMAYFTGTPPETWVPQRFHALKSRAVAGSGANAPVEEIMSGRADIAPIDSVAWPQLRKS